MLPSSLEHSSPLDPETTSQLEEIGGGPAFVEMLVTSLLADLREACVELPRLIEAGDRSASQLAHRLKSASGTIGATRLNTALAAVDAASRGQNPESAREFVGPFLEAASELTVWAETTSFGGKSQ